MVALKVHAQLGVGAVAEGHVYPSEDILIDERICFLK